MDITTEGFELTGVRAEADDVPPVIEDIDAPETATANTDIEVRVSVRDEGGLARIDVLYESDDRKGRPSLARVELSGEKEATETLILRNISAGSQEIRVLVRDLAGNNALRRATISVDVGLPVPLERLGSRND